MGFDGLCMLKGAGLKVSSSESFTESSRPYVLSLPHRLAPVEKDLEVVNHLQIIIPLYESFGKTSLRYTREYFTFLRRGDRDGCR